MLSRTFHEIELESWSQKAGVYDRLFASVSTQAIAPILDSLGNLTGRRLLDVAAGTGHLVAAAAQRLIISEGVDFAAPMVAAARVNYPNRTFRIADALELPYDDASFDAVTCAFGVPHMANPQAAVNEAFRVLKPGWRFAFTLWFGADDGGDFQRLVQRAVQRHATEKIVLPESWTVMRFASETGCEALAHQAGFLPPVFEHLDIVWRTPSTQAVLDLVDKLSLRTAMVINAQPEPVRTRIYEQIASDAESYRRDNVITLGFPALLTVAQKPA